MKIKNSLLIFLALLFFQSVGYAEQKLTPSEVESKEKPFDAELILRRQTLIVRDIEASLALYRDALGMEVIYDQEINRPHPSQDRTQKLRLIFLKATHSFVGILGLIDYEYGYPDHPAHQKPVKHEGFTPGNSILIFNTTDLDAKWRSIVNKEGIKIISPPKLTKYPSYDGEGVLRVKVSKFYDPDGFLVELNQLLDPL
jgi:catechol 2,3-dioxygenase-like lactoylglutathione lyase family enzyme